MTVTCPQETHSSHCLSPRIYWTTTTPFDLYTKQFFPLPSNHKLAPVKSVPDHMTAIVIAGDVSVAATCVTPSVVFSVGGKTAQTPPVDSGLAVTDSTLIGQN